LHCIALQSAWSIVHKMDKSLFPQAVVIPLMDDHGMLAQVAGHHVDVAKLITPLTLTREQADLFLDAFETVMSGLERFPRPMGDLLTKIGKLVLMDRPARGAA
jgi:ornithine--oxo-acid transaminase